MTFLYNKNINWIKITKSMPKFWKKTILTYLGVVYFINNILIIPWYIKDEMKTNFFDEKIQQKTRAEKFLIEYTGDSDMLTYKYLKLSSILTDTYLTYDMNIKKYDNYRETSLEKGIGVCLEMSEYTYSNFLYFTEKTEKYPYI